MSKRAAEWAKAFEAGRGVWMPRSHWRALRVVAQFYHEGLGCAFATVERLADEAGMSSRHMRRTLSELNEMGVVRRNAVQRTRDKSDASNEYELPGYRLVDADPAMRSRIFSIARERVVEQAQLELSGREDDLSPWMLFLVRMRTKNAVSAVEGGSPGLAGRGVEGECPAANVVPIGRAEGVPLHAMPVDREEECPGEADALSGAPRTPCPPVELTFEGNDEIEPPCAPPCRGADVETCERQPQRQKLPDREHCMQRTAFGEEQKQKLPDRDGGSGKVVVFPKRHRSPREPREASVARECLDGEDAALWDEATRVMRACGVSPESSGRKVRRAVLEALRLECERSGRPIADVGLLMEKRWHEYEALGSLRYAPMGFRKFIAEGDWLRQNWGLDRARLKEMRRGGL